MLIGERVEEEHLTPVNIDSEKCTPHHCPNWHNGKMSSSIAWMALTIYLDLSKAFDKFNHSILLDKLDYYGIQYLSLSCLKGFNLTVICIQNLLLLLHLPYNSCQYSSGVACGGHPKKIGNAHFDKNRLWGS
jgi:hypothetical protein